jgi:hypothetical protein
MWGALSTYAVVKAPRVTRHARSRPLNARR